MKRKMKNIRNMRNRRGMSQKDLERNSGIPQSQISRLEQGRDATLTTLGKLAQGFGLSIPDFLTELLYREDVIL